MPSQSQEQARKEVTLANQLKDRAVEADERLSQLARESGEKIGETAATVKTSAKEMAKNGRAYVKENPVKGIVIATAVGALLGCLFTVGFRRRS